MHPCGTALLVNYDETTVYDQAISEEDLFAQYMNTFMKIKMEAYCYSIGYRKPQEQTAYIERVCAHGEISFSHDNIVYSAGRRTVAKLCLNNIWENLAWHPDRCTKEFVTEPLKFFELISNANYERHHCFLCHHSRQTGVVQIL